MARQIGASTDRELQLQRHARYVVVQCALDGTGGLQVRGIGGHYTNSRCHAVQNKRGEGRLTRITNELLRGSSMSVTTSAERYTSTAATYAHSTFSSLFLCNALLLNRPRELVEHCVSGLFL